MGRTKTIMAEGGEGQAQTTTTAEKYVYDDDDVVLDFYKPDGGSFSLARRYLYGPGADQLFAQENVAEDISDPDRVYWMLTDNLGTVRDIVNHAGTLVAGGHFQYDAFGNILAGDKTLTRYLYTAREFDSTTGLQYNRERWYDSNTGRWLSEDPIGFAGDPSNLYRYVGNGPTNATDPTGTEAWTVSTATAKLRELRRLWLEAGYRLAPSLLGDYLNRRTGVDKSQYADLVKDRSEKGTSLIFKSADPKNQ